MDKRSSEFYKIVDKTKSKIDVALQEASRCEVLNAVKHILWGLYFQDFMQEINYSKMTAEEVVNAVCDFGEQVQKNYGISDSDFQLYGQMSIDDYMEAV